MTRQLSALGSKSAPDTQAHAREILSLGQATWQ
nr:hypothetical protein NCS320_00040 [Salmonella enterica]